MEPYQVFEFANIILELANLMSYRVQWLVPPVHLLPWGVGVRVQKEAYM